MKSTVLLESHLKRLKLPMFLQEYRSASRECAEKGKPYEEFLLGLSELEVQSRETKAIERRLRQAGFPVEKELSGFDFDAAPKLNKKRILDLTQGEYILDSQKSL